MKDVTSNFPLIVEAFPSFHRMIQAQSVVYRCTRITDNRHMTDDVPNNTCNCNVRLNGLWSCCLRIVSRYDNAAGENTVCTRDLQTRKKNDNQLLGGRPTCHLSPQLSDKTSDQSLHQTDQVSGTYMNVHSPHWLGAVVTGGQTGSHAVQ